MPTPCISFSYFFSESGNGILTASLPKKPSVLPSRSTAATAPLSAALRPEVASWLVSASRLARADVALAQAQNRNQRGDQRNDACIDCRFSLAARKLIPKVRRRTATDSPGAVRPSARKSLTRIKSRSWHGGCGYSGGGPSLAVSLSETQRKDRTMKFNRAYPQVAAVLAVSAASAPCPPRPPTARRAAARGSTGSTRIATAC